MTTSYPGAVDNFTNPTTSDPMNSATVPHATQHANANDAIEAIETVLGTNPQGTSSTVKDRITAAEGAILNLGIDVGTRVPGETGSNAPTGALPNGYMWVDTTDNSVKVWNGTTWVDPSNAGGGSTGPTWAVVSGGTVTEYTHPTYGVMQVHTFAANGTLTCTTEGQAIVLVVSGGFSDAGNAQRNAGRAHEGTYTLPASALAVTICPGGDSERAPTSLGTVTAAPMSLGAISQSHNVGAGGIPGNIAKGLVSSITGTAVEYAMGNGSTPGCPGQNGTLIVAVKKP